MSQGNPLFDRNEMLTFFTKIGEKCKEMDVYLEIAVYGGSAIMLQPSLFDIRRATEDVDYVPLQEDSNKQLDKILKQVTDEMGYTDRVFRDDVKMLISENPDYDFFVDYPAGEGFFRVFTASPEYLLAMKAMAMRSGMTSNDPTDFFYLADLLNIKTIGEVEEIVEQYFPCEKLPQANRLNIQDILEYNENRKTQNKSVDEHYIRYLAR